MVDPSDSRRARREQRAAQPSRDPDLDAVRSLGFEVAEPSRGAAPRANASGGGASDRGRKRRRGRLSPLTVIGELLLVAGIAVFGYLVWQPWHTGLAVVDKQAGLAADDSAKWREQAAEQPKWDGKVPVVPKPEAAQVFGVLYVPAFGKTYANRMAQTTDWWTVLNLDEKGIGHYENTQMPGEPGNFAVAGHRSGPLINSFREIMNLRVGDPLYVETAQGWYTYRFRNVEYVLPNETDVLNPFPRLDGTPGKDQIMTLTTCHPKLAGSTERAIGYAVFEDYRPLSEGPPPTLAKVNPDVAKQSKDPNAPAGNPVEHAASQIGKVG